MGAPAVGSYAFYTLGSVFVWVLALLPAALIPYGISVMAILKHAVCATTSFCYLRRMMKNERLALLGSVLYTFSSFTLVNTQFYHFTEVIAFFPLILLGMEMVMSDRPAFRCAEGFLRTEYADKLLLHAVQCAAGCAVLRLPVFQ
ncbi:MAG: YfhO family protein [Christensenellales bacterium]